MDVVPCTFEHEVPDGCVRLLGARQDVVGAMTRVDLSDSSILVDCGQPQGKKAVGWRLPQEAQDTEAVVLTHAHLDHISGLPLLLEHFTGPVYATPATLEIAEHNLVGALGLNRASRRQITDFRRRLRAGARSVGYQQALPVGRGGVRLELHEAGHILGSASVELESSAARVIVSGDLGRPGTPLLRDYETGYRNHRPVDLVVMESTYGDRSHGKDPSDVVNDLESAIVHALEDGGHILVPAFSIGRTQTLLYHLNTLVESGRLPDILVAVDSPMASTITDTYCAHRQLFDDEARALLQSGDDPLDFEGLYAVSRSYHSRQLTSIKEPMILIAGSGMCTGGRIVRHLIELLPQPETCVLFVGYQAQGTPGRAILRAARGRRGDSVELGGQRVPVRAAVSSLSGLSAHADREELATWVRAIPSVRRLALHHGEREAQLGLARWLELGLGQ